MKRYLIILSLVIALALIILISLRLSNDALAVIIGVGLGVLASVPTSLLLVFALTRQNKKAETALQNQPGLPNNQQPPVVIVNGGQQPSLSAGQPAHPSYQMQVPTSRTFTIVGEETTEL